MPKKTDKLNIRMTPDLMGTLRDIAKIENRTLSNMVETLVLDRSREHGVVKPDANKRSVKTKRSLGAEKP